MGKLSRLKDKLLNYSLRIRGHRRERKKQKNLRRKNLAKSFVLTKEQKRQIDDFYKTNLGKKINYKWHKLYSAISGRFDYKYLPEYFYTPDVQRLLNNKKYSDVLADKNILPLLIRGSGLNIKTPHSLFACSNGIILDENQTVITKEKLLSSLINKGEIFIKPTVDSCSGQGCILINTLTLSKAELEKIIKDAGKNYCIQEVVKNQKDISMINPSSLNTFRITTYLLDGKAYTFPVVLRVGRNNNCCDNAHAGGLFLGVSDSGDIISNGKTEFGEDCIEHPDSHIKFIGYHIKNVDKLLEAAKSLAYLVPQMGLIDWDLTLNEKGGPVLIEGNFYNGSIWLSQMSHGIGSFKENTAKILQLIKENKTKY